MSDNSSEITKHIAAFSTPTESIESDITSPEFTQRLADLRKVYEAQGLQRTQFNAMVCDELARRGITPTAAAVLKAGHWGSTGHVVEDVSKWFASVAERLTVRHASIPDAVQHQAGKLFESLWALAITQAAQPLQAQLEAERSASSQEIERLNEALMAATQASDEQSVIAREKLDALNDALTRESALLGLKEAELLTTTEALAESEKQRHITQSALEAAQRDYLRRLSEAQAATEAEKRATEQLHQVVTDNLNARVTRLEAEIAQERKEKAIAIDQARQDAREANTRAEKAQKRADDLLAEALNFRDTLAKNTLESARLQRDLEAAHKELQEADEALKGRRTTSTKQKVAGPIARKKK